VLAASLSLKHCLHYATQIHGWLGCAYFAHTPISGHALRQTRMSHIGARANAAVGLVPLSPL
jgi:hypothetical protein